MPSLLNMLVVIITTTPNIEDAESLAEKLVFEKLAACVQILPRISSFYYWQGEVRKENEYLLLIKTLDEKYTQVETLITNNHSYSVPEIISMETKNVSATYLEWVTGYLG